eukprot:15141-Heterococcus_DN1.PRE.2
MDGKRQLQISRTRVQFKRSCCADLRKTIKQERATGAYLAWCYSRCHSTTSITRVNGWLQN